MHSTLLWKLKAPRTSMAAMIHCPSLRRAASLSPVAFGRGVRASEPHHISSVSSIFCLHGTARLRYSSPPLFGLTVRHGVHHHPRGMLCTRKRASLSGGGEAVCLQAAEELPEALQKIVKKFQMGGLPDNPQTQRLRYQQLLAYATKLKPLPRQYHLPENKVEGCVSQVWVLPTLQEGKVYFQADSDSQLVKGLAALLVEGLSGSAPEQILRVEPDFIQLLGLRGSLTPSRNNGFLNLLKLMQKKTLQLCREQQAAETAAAGEATSSGDEAPRSEGGAASPSGSGNGAVGQSNNSGDTASVTDRPIYSSMQTKLREALSPEELHIEDVSHQHAGHAGVHKGAKETHFNVMVVSEAFEGKSGVKRHRMIYGLLADEFKSGLHALSLITKTPSEKIKA